MARRAWHAVSTGVDHFVLGLDRTLRPPFFRGTAWWPPPTPEEFIAEQEARPPRVRWPARFQRRRGRIRIRMPVIAFDTFAELIPARATRVDTAFVYHHGLAELPHDASAARIMARSPLRRSVDCFAIRGPHHDTRRAVFQRLLYSQESFIRGLFSSVFAARALAAHLRRHYRHVVIGGVSLGGVVALVEASLGSVFDLHLPLQAGPDLDALVYRSALTRNLCRRYLARARREGVEGSFDLAGRLAGEGPPIRALLSTHDQLFHLGPQQAAYARVPRARVEIISGGHITGVIRFRRVARFIGAALREELWAPSAPDQTMN